SPPHLHSFPTRRSSDLCLLRPIRLPAALVSLLQVTLGNGLIPRVRRVADGQLPRSDKPCQVGQIVDLQCPRHHVSELEKAYERRSEEHTSELQSRGHLV